jgi:mycothiol synthase
MTELSAGAYAPKQLSMTLALDGVGSLALPTLPEGYLQRSYRPGDEAGWLELLLACGFDEWDLKAVDEHLRDLERREGSSVVVRGGRIVAATFASRQNSPRRAGVLDYVVCHPEYRGLGLGRAVCVAVLRFFAGRGYDSAVLLTDDWRLPAVGLYLSLGFTPEMTRDDMPARWETVRKELARRSP